MIALVFLNSLSTQQRLVNLLSSRVEFSEVHQANSLSHSLALAEQHTRAIGFYSVHQSCRNIASQYWVGVGTKQCEAINAFSHNALGFISYPFNDTQLSNSIEYVAARYAIDQRDGRFKSFIYGLCAQYGVPELSLMATLKRELDETTKHNVIAVRDEKGWSCLHPSEIKWIEAAGDYMCIHTLTENVVVRATLCDLLMRFGEENVKRCSRSLAVNPLHVARFEQHGNQQRVVMVDGETFKITQKYYYQFWQ